MNASQIGGGLGAESPGTTPITATGCLTYLRVSKQNKTKQNKTKQNKTKQNKTENKTYKIRVQRKEQHDGIQQFRNTQAISSH